MMSLLQAITFDDWTVAMYALMQAMSPYVFIYFVLIGARRKPDPFPSLPHPFHVPTSYI